MEATAEKEAPAEHKAVETATPQSLTAAPVMDVKPPRHNEAPAEKSDDVVAPPPPEEDGSVETAQPPQPQAAQVTKPPKQKSNGVGLAVFGTVVIVLGLAALAVYAYMQTNK